MQWAVAIAILSLPAVYAVVYDESHVPYWLHLCSRESCF